MFGDCDRALARDPAEPPGWRQEVAAVHGLRISGRWRRERQYLATGAARHGGLHVNDVSSHARFRNFIGPAFRRNQTLRFGAKENSEALPAFEPFSRPKGEVYRTLDLDNDPLTIRKSAQLI
jgi:hypothetical protein